MAQCLIGLGSNLGNRPSLLDGARLELDAVPGTRVVCRSRYHETLPIGGPQGQDAFLNGAALVETALTPFELLNKVAGIEEKLGRQRVKRWGPRSIDLDLLLYDDLVIDSSELQLPHPRMAWRHFVLAPAVEVAPALKHPRIGWTIERLLNHLNTATDYIAIAGPPGAGKTSLAQAAATQLGGQTIADPASLDCSRRAFKSYGIELEAQIELARRRSDALDVNAPIWKEHDPPWISDFWLGQSAAAIRAFSQGSQCEALLQRWRQVTRRACRPKLTVIMNTPSEYCIGRLAEHGLSVPDAGYSHRVDALRRQLNDRTNQVDLGPVLSVDGQDSEGALEELVAAVLSMRQAEIEDTP